ncbi:DUF7144 family membrane protein [Kribbella sp. CA-253562]|uniref:DUF7144 family membrane protein n=1 Tax=Kribbella sp. CA-253562 TaxID=3239942 RepID=UPI003D94BEB1
MSHSTKAGQGGAAPQTWSQGVQPTRMTGWVGWIAFAGVMMTLLGTFHVMQGLVALFKDEYFLVGQSELTIHIDYTAWGWIHIVGGLVVAAAGFALFAGKVWARVVGVVVAMVSAIVNAGFLAAYPIWSVTMIAIDLLVIWALTVHGHEVTE